MAHFFFQSKVRAIFALFFLFLASQGLFIFGERTWMPMTGIPSTGINAPFGYSGHRPNWTTSIDPGGGWNASFTWDAYRIRGLKQGHFPFWNPYQFLGIPFLENGLSASLYPFHWLEVLVPPLYWDWVMMVDWFLAGVFLFLYLCEMEFSIAIAFFGGATVFVSGYFQSFASLREVAASAAWFPLILTGIEKARKGYQKSSLFILALSVYCTLTGGQVEVAFISLMASAFYALFYLKAWRTIFFGTLCGALISSPAWFNFAYYGFLKGRSIHESGSEHGLRAWIPAGMISYFFPSCLGALQRIPEFFLKKYLPPDITPGSVPGFLLPLACLSFGSLVKKPFGKFFIFGAVLVFFKCFGVPGINELGNLPLFSRVIFPRYAGFLLPYFIGILAASGLSRLCVETKFYSLIKGLWLSVFCVCGFIFLLFIAMPTEDWNLLFRSYLALYWFQGALWMVVPVLCLLWLKFRMGVEELGIVFAAIAASTLQGILFFPYGAMVEPVSLVSYYAIIFFICLCVWIGALWGTFFKGAFERFLEKCLKALGGYKAWGLEAFPLVLILSLLGFSLVFGNGHLFLFGPPDRVEPIQEPEYISVLKKLEQGGVYRMLALDAVPAPNFNSVFGLSSLGVLDPLLPESTYAFFSHYMDSFTIPQTYFGSMGLIRNSGPSAVEEYISHRLFFQKAGVRFIAVTNTQEGLGDFAKYASKDSRFRLVYGSAKEGYQVWEDQGARARLYFATQTQVVSDWKQALSQAASQVDRLNLAITDQGPVFSGLSSSSLPSPSSSLSPSTSLRPLGVSMEMSHFDLQENEESADIVTHAPGVLVSTESYMDGWRVEVDGVESVLLRVDGAFRGVALSNPGVHHIRFWYRPFLWNFTLFLGSLGLFFLVALLGKQRVRTFIL